MINPLERARKHLASDYTHDDAEEIIRDLLAIIERGPITADGVPVIEGDAVWWPRPRGYRRSSRMIYENVERLRVEGRAATFIPSGGCQLNQEYVAVAECYSTKEAAEAARAKME